MEGMSADGRPHVAPVWFDLGGDTVVFTTWHSSVKARNIRRDPRVSLCVDDQEPPFAFVLIEGAARGFERDPDLRYRRTRIAVRYAGAELAASYGERNGVGGELLLRATPDKIVARKNVSG